MGNDRIEAEARECARLAVAVGYTTRLREPLPGDWDALAELLGRQPTDEEQRAFARAYVEHIKEHAADPRTAYVLFSEEGYVVGAAYVETEDEALSAAEDAADAEQLAPARCHDCGDEGYILPPAPGSERRRS